MEVLPFELVEFIVWYADVDTRRQLLTVSRRFQVAVERFKWSAYRSLPNDNMEEFLAMYHGHRSRFLRNITISMRFPILQHSEEEPLMCRERSEEVHAKNELITRQVLGLFTALKTLERRELPNNQPTGIRLHIETPYQVDDNKQHCDHRRYHSWRLRLLNPQTLPELSSIRTLGIGEGTMFWSDFSCSYERPLDLGMVADLICKLPNLEVLNCVYVHERFPLAYEDAVIRHFTRPWEGPWRDSRHSFGKVIAEATLPDRIKSVRLHFGESSRLGSMVDQSVALPNLVMPLPYDPLSSALRVLSRNLTKLDLRVCADSNLFWPSLQEEGEGTAPLWPYLKHLCVEFQPCLPSGEWYFQGPRGEGRHTVGYPVTEKFYPPVNETESDEEWDDIWNYEGGRFENFITDIFRTVPIDEKIEPFLEAFAKSLGRMPLLEEADLYTYLSWDPSGDREEEYPDLELKETYRWGVRYQVLDDVPRLEWQVGDWRPSKALQQLFHNIGGHRTNTKPLEEQ